MSYPVWRSNRGGGWDAFGELQALRSELGRLMGSALVGGRSDVDLDTDENGWVVTARLPGVAPDEVVVEVDDREVNIREQPQEDAGDRRPSFQYRIALPAETDPDKVDAVMDHGLLVVRLPRAARTARRTIAVGRSPRDRSEGDAGTDSAE